MWTRVVYWTCFALVIGLVLPHAVEATDPDLVGWWKLDEGSGATAVDSSGNGNDGAIQGPANWVAGQLHGALEFNGSESQIDIPYTPDMTPSEGTTMSAWVFPTDTTRSCIIGQFEGYGMALAGGLQLKSVIWGGDWVLSDVSISEDEWSHIAMTWDVAHAERLVFLNGERVGQRGDSAVPSVQNNLGIGLWVGWPAAWGDDSFMGILDDVRVYKRVLMEEEIAEVMEGQPATIASEPQPAHEQTDVPRDVLLQWEPGQSANTHDVYFGAVFDDVNDASRSNPLGVLVSQDQADVAYAPESVLEFGQTYFWRIDEVNAPPDSTIFKGEIWSFSTEPLAYPIGNVTATSNGIADVDSEPENTVNGSGLNADDLHSTESTDMWLASPAGDAPLTITFEFDRVYKMHEMLVWNYNVAFELLLGFGVQDATVEYSADGAEWTILGDVVLAQATATDGYAANTAVDLQGVAAQYVRLTINGAYGAMGKYGLSEVRFMQIPAHAREPEPADEATDVDVAAALAWRAGRDALTHDVYLSTDPDALELIDTTGATTTDPGVLDLASTYYWKVDAVQDTESWEGDLWSFTTQAYLVVDDFESYDDEDNVIYETWIDGWVNGTGSTVGYLQAPFAEQSIVHSGSQSMPLFYDNADVATSETDFELSQNWTLSGIQTLSLFFRGQAGNTGQLYAKINGTKVLNEEASTDLARNAWQPWNIDLDTVGGNLANVTSLTIGVQGNGTSGKLYIDAIRLYPYGRKPGLVVTAVPNPPTLDGVIDLGEYGPIAYEMTLDKIAVDGGTFYTGSEGFVLPSSDADLSSVWYLAYDADNLYVAGIVRDDIVYDDKNGAGLNMTDALQFMIDSTGAFADGLDNNPGTDSSVTIHDIAPDAVAASGAEYLEHWGATGTWDRVQVAGSLSADGYIVECSLPLDAFTPAIAGAPGTVIGMTLIEIDQDGSSWGTDDSQVTDTGNGSWDNVWNTSNFNLAVFGPMP